MRSVPCVFAICILALTAATASGQPVGAGATVTATFGPRSAVRASVSTLVFDVVDPAQPAIASIEFAAAARTATGAEVLLLVGAAGGVRGPGGAADVDTSLALEGGSEGLMIADVRPFAPSTAARWIGGGRRTGRLSFSLRASAPGTYTVPVTLSLSVP